MKLLPKILIGAGAAGVLGVIGLVGSVYALSGRSVEVPYPEVQVSQDPAVIERGRYLVHGPMHCSICHTTREVAGTIAPGVEPDLSGGAVWDTPFGLYVSRNITPDEETGIGSWTPQEVARAIRSGVTRDGRIMPFMSTSLGDVSDEDLSAIVSYVLSRPAVRNEVPPSEPGFVGNAMLAFVMQPNVLERSWAAPPPRGVTLEWGEYLATGPAFCVGCHTAFEGMDFYHTGPQPFGGSMPEPDPETPGQVIQAPNLTPHPTTGHIASWTEETFVARFRAPRVYQGSKMPWESFRNLSDDDLRAIWRYLQTVAPVDNNTSPTVRPAE